MEGYTSSHDWLQLHLLGHAQCIIADSHHIRLISQLKGPGLDGELGQLLSNLRVFSLAERSSAPVELVQMQ